MPSPGSQKVGHLARRGKVGTGRVAVLDRGPRYGTSRACGSRQLAGVGWGEEGLERSWGLWLMGQDRPFLPGSLSRRVTGRAGWGLGGQEGGGRRDGGWWTD